MKDIQRIALTLYLSFIILGNARSQTTDKMMIVIIDGARYSETLGDLSQTYTPKMWKLTSEGTMVDQFLNDQYTYTSRAIPALWCGKWTDVRDTTYDGHDTQYSVSPSIFEYYRMQKAMPEEECTYVLKSINSLWLPSFNASYGPDYWPLFHSVGNDDRDVAEQAKIVMDSLHPHFIWVCLADVDHAGHSGNWNTYINAIRTSDSIVGELWEYLQSDPFYQNSTTMFVTNDHGRHDDEHGGFKGHGDGCPGCRHIEFLALGPLIKKNYVSRRRRNTPDMAVTAAYLLGLDPDFASGHVMHEIFKANGLEEETLQIDHLEANPNPFGSLTNIHFHLSEAAIVSMSIYNISGKQVFTYGDQWRSLGDQIMVLDGKNNQGDRLDSGIYLYRIQSKGQEKLGKLIFMP